jgi:hypothetical protein
LRGLDHDRLVLLHDDLLLLVALEVAGLRGLRTQALRRRQDAFFVGEHRVAELLRPLELLVHHLEDLRERGQGLHRRIPVLLPGGLHHRVALELVPVRLDEARRLDDVERVGRRHQRLHEELVGIQRDRRDEAVELVLRELGRGGGAAGGRGGRGGRLGAYRPGQRQRQSE